MLDGASNNDPENNLNLPLPFPDALQEFKVETSALPAQYGYHSAAAATAVTKSGTNQFHGDVFDFVRNGVFNARNFFATSRDSLKRNQFGGVIGGPIIKNRLFFFGGYQGTTQRSAPSLNITRIPTAAMLVGDFARRIKEHNRVAQRIEHQPCRKTKDGKAGEDQGQPLLLARHGVPILNDFASSSKVPASSGLSLNRSFAVT